MTAGPSKGARSARIRAGGPHAGDGSGSAPEERPAAAAPAGSVLAGPVLGIDLGARRIGLALSDEEARIAFPAGALERVGLERDLVRLGALAAERSVTRIVVGLPRLLSGREGVGAEAARRFAHALEEATGLPVELIDERLTTAEADRALREAPAKRRRRRKEVIDAMAATLLLRTWLEQAGRR